MVIPLITQQFNHKDAEQFAKHTPIQDLASGWDGIDNFCISNQPSASFTASDGSCDSNNTLPAGGNLLYGEVMVNVITQVIIL